MQMKDLGRGNSAFRALKGPPHFIYTVPRGGSAGNFMASKRDFP